VNSIALFTAATDSFNQNNVGMTVREQLDGFRELMPSARQNGLRVRAYVSTALHCPFDGPVSPDRASHVVEVLLEIGVDEISVGDTIGHAVPIEVAKLTEALLPILPIDKFAYHFHDTHGTALANVMMALQFGVAIYDSSAGGLGGCPFAPGAAGNLATEDLLGMLHGMNIETGVDVRKVMDASLYMEAVLGRYFISKYLISEGGSGSEVDE